MLVAVTGANGFIGQALCSELLSRGISTRAIVRDSTRASAVAELDCVSVGDISRFAAWTDILQGVDCVVHCAARAHVLDETETDALAAYRLSNVVSTQRLAEQSALGGVSRLVYLSSIGVNGNNTNDRGPFVSSDTPSPIDDYAISKWEAEQALRAVAAETGLDVVVVRPPLVYGPAVKGNFLRLLRMVETNLPLPFAAVRNQRSFVGLDNLVGLLIDCVEKPAAAGDTFLVSDDEDLSTPDLIRVLAHSMHKSQPLLPVPVGLLRACGQMIGKRDQMERLVGSLQVDSSYTRQRLSWTPRTSVAAGLQSMVEWFLRVSSFRDSPE